jgi:succinoglycan biosynthesis transport protein ExoP
MFKRYWWMFFVMVPVGSFAGLLVAAVITYLMPRKYESEAVIEVMQRHQTPGRDVSEPHYTTEAEILKSRKALEQVAVNLELPKRWNTDKETAIHILKGTVKTRRIDGTDLISIRVRHTNKIDARDIAGELVSVYKANLAETDARESERYIQEMNSLIRDQEDKVEERRKVLSTIVRTKGIIYTGSDDVQQAERNALQAFHQLEQEKLQLESQISSLLKYDSDQLLVYAAGLNPPDNVIRKLYPPYLEAKRALDVMKTKGLGDDHPSLRETAVQIEMMRKQIDEGLVNLRATLQAQLELAKDRLKSVEKDWDEKAVKAIKSSLDAQDYVDAKREFESDQELLQQMKLKLVGEKIALKTAADSVRIHDEPVIAQVPISPNVTLNLLLGTGAGFLLSPLMALPLMWLLNRTRPAQTAA